ncbi:MAG: hypothetical protein HN610_11860, partial [Verrucomicrobia bacterium]|nr:hypothetical protein [Verrucomicrobiota bacterium]
MRKLLSTNRQSTPQPSQVRGGSREIFCTFVLLAGTFLSGCSTKHYEVSANREAASLIAEKTPLVANMDADFNLEQLDPTDLVDLPKHEVLDNFLGAPGQS